ncbi:MAG TPA: hypothetical protein VNF29_10935 [Candidatus Binataceae bacterium]|nr:hypothetical protein [Candidatus Binataceae bacterium]
MATLVAAGMDVPTAKARYISGNIARVLPAPESDKLGATGSGRMHLAAPV